MNQFGWPAHKLCVLRVVSCQCNKYVKSSPIRYLLHESGTGSPRSVLATTLRPKCPDTPWIIVCRFPHFRLCLADVQDHVLCLIIVRLDIVHCDLRGLLGQTCEGSALCECFEEEDMMELTLDVVHLGGVLEAQKVTRCR